LEHFKSLRVCGGLGIKGSSISNIALGSKILWRLVIGKNEWWKKVILHKYFLGERLCFLDNEPVVQGGSQIWILLKCNIPDIKSMQNRNKMLEMEDEQQYNHNNTTIILK
jgi:hypothetical protein